MHCKHGRKVLPTPFTIQDGSPAVLTEGEAYRHLGIPTGFKADQSPTKTVDKLLADIEAINASFLAPWQKIDAVVSFLTPRSS